MGPGIRRGEGSGLRGIEAEAAIISRIAEHEEQGRAGRLGRRDTRFDQRRTNTRALPFRQHRHGREAEGGDGHPVGTHLHRAEGDMAEDSALIFGDQADRQIAVPRQRLDQIGFGRCREGGEMHGPDRLAVLSSGRPDAHHTKAISGASSCFMPTV